MGGGHQRAKSAPVPPTELPQKPNNWSDLAGDGLVAGGGDVGGGAPESSVGATKSAPVPLLSSLTNLTTGPIWLVTGWWRGGGGDVGGGAQRAVWEPRRVHRFLPLSSLKNLTTGPIWLVTGWRAQCSQGCAGSIH